MALRAEPRVLVLGASGLVGSHVLREAGARGWAAQGTTCSQAVDGLARADLLDAAATRGAIAAARPDVVVLAAYGANVDGVEADPDAARPLNVDAQQRVADEAAATGARLVWFSTDYVFDGAAGPYSEDDAPAPLCAYGEQKLEVEQWLLATHPDALVLRVTWIFGAERRGMNFAARLAANLAKGADVTVPGDQLSNPTHAGFIAECALDLAAAGASGIVHVAGADWCSRLEHARRTAARLGLPTATLRGVATSALNQRARRPLRGGLRCGRLRALLGREPEPLDRALDRLAASL